MVSGRKRSRTLPLPTCSGAGFSAHQGAITVPNHFRPGLIYNPTEETWRTVAVSDLDELGQRMSGGSDGAVRHILIPPRVAI